MIAMARAGAVARHRRSAGDARRCRRLQAAVGRILVRHRHAGARRLQPRGLRRARLAGGRLVGRALSARSSASPSASSPASCAGSTRIVMRVMDGLMSIPPVLLAIALMALTKASVEQRDPRHHASPRCRASSRLVRSLVLTLARAALRRGGDRRRHAHCRASSCATSCRTPWRRCWCRRPTSAPRP